MTLAICPISHIKLIINMLINGIEDYLNANYKLYKAGYVVMTKPKRPHSEKQKENKLRPSKERKFVMNKMKLRSACVDFWYRRKNKSVLFLTFTFPVDVTEKEGARIWELMLNNLRNNYEVTNYVWVKERQKQGRYHYHILVDCLFVDIKNLQKTWESCVFTVTNVCHNTSNSVRLGDRPRVFSVKKVRNYLSKYVSKAERNFEKETGKQKVELSYTGRCYGYSQGLIISRSIDFVDFDVLSLKYKVVQLCDDPYFRIYLIKNYIDPPIIELSLVA